TRFYKGVAYTIVEPIAWQHAAHHDSCNRAANLLSVIGESPVSHIWTIKDSADRVVPNFIGASRLAVERKVVPTYYDPFRLHVSRSYRQISTARWRRSCRTSVG